MVGGLLVKQFLQMVATPLAKIKKAASHSAAFTLFYYKNSSSTEFKYAPALYKPNENYPLPVAF